MKIITTPYNGLTVFQPLIHQDHRGFFMETWRDEWQKQLEIPHAFIQDNHACSKEAGVLRGLHFQTGDTAQGKLVWVTKGAVFDVAVDLRPDSSTFGQWHGLELNAKNALRFYIGRGFAHGYVTLEPDTEFHYKVDAYYSPATEKGIRWDDPDLAITWPVQAPILSEKDALLPSFAEYKAGI